MQNVDRDIIVIGAGGCGLMAALVAAKKGTQVLLLEKTDKPGGGTAFSSKGIRAAGSRRQHELKIDDSAALYAQDILQRNNGESDAVIIGRLAETSGRVADFLTDEAGIQFQIGEFVFGHSAQRSPICSSPQWSAKRISRYISPRRCSRSSRSQTSSTTYARATHRRTIEEVTNDDLG